MQLSVCTKNHFILQNYADKSLHATAPLMKMQDHMLYHVYDN